MTKLQSFVSKRLFCQSYLSLCRQDFINDSEMSTGFFSNDRWVHVHSSQLNDENMLTSL